jgi:hypothetical protein
VKPTPLALVAPPDDWAQVERWSVRAQALAELRALSERETTPEATVRSIRLP